VFTQKLIECRGLYNKGANENISNTCHIFIHFLYVVKKYSKITEIHLNKVGIGICIEKIHVFAFIVYRR